MKILRLKYLIMYSIACIIIYFVILDKYTFKFWHQKLDKNYYSNFTELSLDLRKYLINSSDILTIKLFPWLYYFRNSSDLTYYSGEKNTKGIVICVGDHYSDIALIAIKALEIIGNDLPIEIVYSNSRDLSLHNQEMFKKNYSYIRLIDLSTMAFNFKYLKLSGWDIKPYAVLASKFEHVLLIDADVLFFEKPKILFQHPSYLQTGSLFFYDRPNLKKPAIRWIQSFLLKSNQTLPNRTQESGVVLLDKSRVLPAILAICKLNDYEERTQITYKYLYGDKDTWWLGFHMIGMSYSFVPTMTAAIGEVMKRRPKTTMCGLILHFNENNTLIWWNGGMLRSRFLSKKRLLQVDGWLEEGEWRINFVSCLINRKKQPRKFNSRQQELIDQYRQITKQVLDIP